MKTIIGLTGAYCSGKNTAAHILERLGWYIIDLDKLGHDALCTAKKDVIQLLGNDICRADGTLDRKKIAEKVFPNVALLAAYEAIVHPIMFTMLDSCIEQAPTEKICINAAILYKIPHVNRCTKIIEIQSPFLLRFMRGLRRDRRSVYEVFAKMNAQKQLFLLRPTTIPIIILVNIGSTQRLEQKLYNALKHDA